MTTVRSGSSGSRTRGRQPCMGTRSINLGGPLKTRHGRFLALAVGVMALYALARFIDAEPLVLASGAALAFYVPGAVLLNASRFGRTAWIEQIALAIVLSVTFVS